MNRMSVLTGLLLLPYLVWADDSFYCPQNHGYINVGMTQDQVVSACGQPISKQQSNRPVMQQVPMQQLYFKDQGAPTAFYGVWKLPIGQSNYSHVQPFGASNGGVMLQVNVINNQVVGVNINGSSTNAFSICRGRNIKVGDPVNLVYGACGSPSLVNNSFVNRPIPSNSPPQVWIYQPGEYQPPLSLTFIDGKLQSIN